MVAELSRRLSLSCLLGFGLLLNTPPLNAGERAGRECRITYRNIDVGGNSAILAAGCAAGLAKPRPTAWEDLMATLAPLLVNSTPDEGLLAICDRVVGSDVVLALIVDRGSRLEIVQRPPIALVEIESEDAQVLLFGKSRDLGGSTAHQRRRAGETVDRLVMDYGLRLLGESGDEAFRRDLTLKINEAVGAPLVEDAFERSYTLAEPLDC